MFHSAGPRAGFFFCKKVGAVEAFGHQAVEQKMLSSALRILTVTGSELATKKPQVVAVEDFDTLAMHLHDAGMGEIGQGAR